MTQLLPRTGTTKPTRQAARYIAGGGSERCGQCRHFRAPTNCDRIIGPISAGGWCRYFSRELVASIYQPQGAIGSGGGATLDLNFMTPAAFDLRLAFSRASVATYFDVNGVMQMAAANLMWPSVPIGTNWIVSNTVITAAQGIAPDGTNTFVRITENASTTNHLLLGGASVVTAIAGQPYTLSVYAKMATGVQYLQLLFDDNGINGAMVTFDLLAGVISGPMVNTGVGGLALSASITPVGGGTYRCTLSANASITTIRTSFGLSNVATPGRFPNYAGSTSNSLLVWGAQFESGTVATPYIPTTTATGGGPRFDYDPVTHVARGLLIEEARTNVTITSTNFTHVTYNTNALTYTAGQAGAPDGSATFTRMTETASTSARYTTFGFAGFGAGQPVSVSIYASAQQIRYFQMSVDDAGANGIFVTFDLQTGTISGPTTARGTATVLGATIVAVGGGTYRCTISASCAGVNLTRPIWGPSNVGNPGWLPSYTGNVANGLLIWGIQVEQGAFPTSYIPTTAAAVTRATEVLSMPTTGWVNQTVGTLQIELAAMEEPVSTQREITAMGADASNILRLAQPNGASTLLANSFTAGVGRGGPSDAATHVANVAFRGAMTYDATGTIQISSSGSVPTPFGPGVLFPTMSTLSIGGSGTISRGNTTSGWYRRVRYWPRVLSNAELQQVTT